MRVADLIAGTGISLVQGAPDVVVKDLASDSRNVGTGTLFAALPGSTTDGAAFVPAAVAAGATAILVSQSAAVLVPATVAVLRAAEPRAALAHIAARFYPRQPATIVAITGTNGKTSIAEFTRQIFASLGHRAASLGTIGIVKPDGAVYGSLTTPDPITLHRTLDQLAGEGITHLALEASSHGLDQFRLDGVRLSAGAFSNLGRDHLDYHPTVDAYFAAKLRLFTDVLPATAAAIVHADDPRTDEVTAAANRRHLRVLTTGYTGENLRLVEASPDGFDQILAISHAGKMHRVRLPLLGTYQATNALLAAALAIATGADPDRAIAAIATLTGVKGRLDVVGHHNGGIAVVDYAHKPEALAAALDALRPFATGKLITVFGCGGNRDKGKRPIMGAIASGKSDLVIVTDDNPRKEVAAVVRAEILAAAKGAREIGDRAEAIRSGVKLLGPGDVLLVAGKGHEPGQIVGDVTLPFSDHEQIEAAIREATP